MADAVKVLIVDDHPLFRAALEVALIKSGVEAQNIKSLSTIADGMSSLKSENYNLLLLDLSLSDSRGFEGLSKIRAIHQSLSIIIVSATETPQAYTNAHSLGAKGYIPKSSPFEDIAVSIKKVLSGGTSFPENISTVIKDHTDAAQKLSSLTPAQHRVMNCLSDGLLNKQIAFEMGISEATVKAHMTAIFRKLGANNRTQALLVFRDATHLSEA